MGDMDWDDATRESLEVALNESEVVGVRLAPDSSYVDVLLHVNALPESGPLVKDSRRILRLTSPSELCFLLCDQVGGQLAPAAALPLADLAAVEDFFGSLAWSGSVYGWRFFDDPELAGDWPADLSLRVAVRTESSAHTFYWFNECGAERNGETGSYCIEGTVTFDDLFVLDADTREIPIDTFIAEGCRYWAALFARDKRLSDDAQRVAQQDPPRWRAWATGS